MDEWDTSTQNRSPTTDYFGEDGFNWCNVQETTNDYDLVFLDLRRILWHHFGHTSFTKEQEGPIISAVEGKNISLLCPTNFGKSICFQVPALYQDGARKGVTVVIEPTKALIDEQVKKLEGRKVPVLKFHGDVPIRLKAASLQILEEGFLVPLIYILPDSIRSLKSVLLDLNRRDVLARFVFDEAHLRYQWGDKGNFREDQYGEVVYLAKEFPTVPWTIVSATMTGTNLALLWKELNITNSSPHFHLARDRPNLNYEVIYKDERSTIPYIVSILKEKICSTIIFCAYTVTCNSVKKELMKREIDVVTFYGGLGPKTVAQQTDFQKWLDGKCNVMVATSTLGYGIDKRDGIASVFSRRRKHSLLYLIEVGRVILYDIPGSIEEMVQECGRAGRDGEPAMCTVFFKISSVQQRIRLAYTCKDYASIERRLQEIREVVRLCTNRLECRRVKLLRPYGYQLKNCQGGCDNCYLNNADRFKRMDVSNAARYIYSFYSSRGYAYGRRNLGTDVTRSQLEEALHEKLEIQLDGEQNTKLPRTLLQQLVCHLFQEGIFDLRPEAPKQKNRSYMFFVKEGPNVNTLSTGKPIARMDVAILHVPFLQAFKQIDLGEL